MMYVVVKQMHCHTHTIKEDDATITVNRSPKDQIGCGISENCQLYFGHDECASARVMLNEQLEVLLVSRENL